MTPADKILQKALVASGIGSDRGETGRADLRAPSQPGRSQDRAHIKQQDRNRHKARLFPFLLVL